MDIEFMWRLRKALEDKGITRSELSNISGVSKGDISHYLKGHYVPKQDKCYLLAKALDVDPGWLMTGYEPLQKDKELQDYLNDLDKKGAYDIIDLYMELNEEHQIAAKNYLLFLKSQENTNDL